MHMDQNQELVNHIISTLKKFCRWTAPAFLQQLKMMMIHHMNLMPFDTAAGVAPASIMPIQ
jgi:hypothetical protein